MLLPHGTIIAVADGEKLNLYRNGGTDSETSLSSLPTETLKGDNGDSGGRHTSSAANPDGNIRAEDNFAAATAAFLNAEALGHKFEHLVVIAPPRTLGELRHHWHKQLTALLLTEIAKEMTGASIAEIEALLAKQ